MHTPAPTDRLVIFDCDGVLVDSEVLVTRIEAEMLASLGVDLTPDEIAATFVGLSDHEMHRRIQESFGVELPATFEDDKRERIAAAFETDLAPVAGMDVLVAGLAGARCVASSSALPRIRRSLELTGMAPHLEPHLFSASMVTNGKPAPDLFVHAAAAMDVQADRCIVIEDSPHGVAAGLAAGMRVIAFTGGAHCTPSLAQRLRAVGAEEVTERAEDLTSLLDRP